MTKKNEDKPKVKKYESTYCAVCKMKVDIEELYGVTFCPCCGIVVAKEFMPVNQFDYQQKVLIMKEEIDERGKRNY